MADKKSKRSRISLEVLLQCLNQIGCKLLALRIPQAIVLLVILFFIELVQNQIWKFGYIFFFLVGGCWPIFLHESSSWVEIRLHTEFGRVWLCWSWDKVTDGFGLWFGFGFLHRKIRLTQLWVELSWVVAINHLFWKAWPWHKVQSPSPKAKPWAKAFH